MPNCVYSNAQHPGFCIPFAAATLEEGVVVPGDDKDAFFLLPWDDLSSDEAGRFSALPHGEVSDIIMPRACSIHDLSRLV